MRVTLRVPLRFFCGSIVRGPVNYEMLKLTSSLGKDVFDAGANEGPAVADRG